MAMLVQRRRRLVALSVGAGLLAAAAAFGPAVAQPPSDTGYWCICTASGGGADLVMTPLAVPDGRTCGIDSGETAFAREFTRFARRVTGGKAQSIACGTETGAANRDRAFDELRQGRRVVEFDPERSLSP